MDLRKLVGNNNYDSSSPMEGIIHSVPSSDNAALRRTVTDIGRPPSSSSSRGRAPPPPSSRGFWNTVLDRPHPASSSSTSAGASSSSSSARTAGGSSTRTSVASMSFRLSEAPMGAAVRGSSTASPYPLRMQSFHSTQRSPRSIDRSAPYVCPHCNKQYSTLAQLQTHVKRQHKDGGASCSAPTKYQCPSCPHQFSQRSHLNQHLKTVHAGMRPHTCPVPHCGKAFGKRSDLKSHVSSVHENERPFACEFCERRFAKKSNLSRHREKLHRDKLEMSARR
eukprot:TRINITY_DN80499_c0_g1_i1.p1 TRINITY_DN80499_c0_g1~~TRINITY_DN80499_c0_g1_i1.p1  ORF type:complete len:279 (-),score=34.13 TRINITY_DN80499_c0_g1_i1:202-1038(-)